MAVMRGWEIFTRNVGQARNGGRGRVGFIMGGWKIFKVSSHSWQRGANPTILWRTPSPLFFKFCPPSPHFPITSNPNPHCSFCCLFLWLNGWSRGFLLVIWFDITNTQTHKAHLGASRLTHPYKYIFTPPVLCSQQLPLLH